MVRARPHCGRASGGGLHDQSGLTQGQPSIGVTCDARYRRYHSTTTTQRRTKEELEAGYVGEHSGDDSERGTRSTAAHRAGVPRVAPRGSATRSNNLKAAQGDESGSAPLKPDTSIEEGDGRVGVELAESIITATTTTTCAGDEGAHRRVSCGPDDELLGQRQHKQSCSFMQAQARGGQQHAVAQLATSWRGRRAGEKGPLNKRPGLAGSPNEERRDSESGGHFWPRSPSCFRVRASATVASLALNRSSIKIKTTTTTTNQWIGVQCNSESGLSSSAAIRDRREQQQRRRRRRLACEQPDRQRRPCYNQQLYLTRERLFYYSSLSIPQSPTRRRPLWHKRQTLPSSSLGPSANSEIRWGRQRCGARLSDQRRKSAGRHVQHGQVQGGKSCGGGSSRASNQVRASYRGENPIERRKASETGQQELPSRIWSNSNSSGSSNNNNESNHETKNNAGGGGVNTNKANNILDELASDCFPLRVARRQQVSHTQQSRKSSNKGEIVVAATAAAAAAAAAVDASRPISQWPQRRRIVVANLKPDGAYHHLHRRRLCASQSCQATPTPTTAVAHQSARSDSLPECRRSDPPDIGAFASSLLNVSLRSSSTSSSSAATAIAEANTKAPSTTAARLAIAKRSSIGKTTTADINKQSQISPPLHNEEQQLSEIVTVRLPFELAHKSVQRQQQRQHSQQRTGCSRVTRGAELARTRTISSIGRAAGPINSSATTAADQSGLERPSNIRPGSRMETHGERKTARSKMAPGEQQRTSNARPVKGNNSPRPCPLSNVTTSTGKPNRVPLLDTPPSPLTLQIMRQNRVPYSGDKRFSSGHSFQSQLNSNHRFIGSYQFQAAHSTKANCTNEPQAPASPGKKGAANCHPSSSSSSKKTGSSSAASRSGVQPYGRHHQPQKAAAALALAQSEQQEWEQQAPSTNIHSLEVIGHEARMAISIYDPLPGQQQHDHIQSQQQQHELGQTGRSNSPLVVRPSELSIIDETKPNLDFQFDRPRPRRPRCRGRRTSSDRVLKSPTIPEEEGDEQELKVEPASEKGPTAATSSKDESEPPNESFMVATIADDSGDHSRTLVIYSDRSLTDLTKDVLKKLVEIELDRRRDELACRRPSPSTDSDGEASPCESNEGDRRMPELEIEAEKLARLFKGHLEGVRTPSSPSSLVRPRFDPTTMSQDERARFVGRTNRGSPRCRCSTASELSPKLNATVPLDHESQGTGSQQQRDIYDFRCSCCCLHLLNQQRREDGERWCCCGCS